MVVTVQIESQSIVVHIEHDGEKTIRLINRTMVATRLHIDGVTIDAPMPGSIVELSRD